MLPPHVGEAVHGRRSTLIEPTTDAPPRQLRAWAKLALEECGPQFHGVDVAAFPQEIDRLEARLRPLQSPVCLCHNDLNHMNILRLGEVRAGTCDERLGSHLLFLSLLDAHL